MNLDNVRCFGLSRRDLLKRAGTAGGMMLAGAAGAAAAAAKVAPAAAGYQDSAQDGQRCSDCKHFSAPASCQLVDGAISPDGWCKLFSKNG